MDIKRGRECFVPAHEFYLFTLLACNKTFLIAEEDRYYSFDQFLLSAFMADGIALRMDQTKYCHYLVSSGRIGGTGTFIQFTKKKNNAGVDEEIFHP